MKTLACNILILFIGITELRAQDTTGNYTIKALDISVDFGGYNSTFDREKHLLGLMGGKQEALNRITRDYSYFSFIGNYTRPNLEAVISLPQKKKFGFRRKPELKFGISWLTANSTLTDATLFLYDSIAPNGEKNQRYVRCNYYNYQQQIHLTYLINSKVFWRKCKMYAGVNAGYAINVWKGTERNTKSSLSVSEFHRIDTFSNFTSANYSIGRFTANTFFTQIPIGIKYNLSCEFNLFMDLKYGWAYTPALKPDAWQSNMNICLGIRYKFKNSDQSQEQDSWYW